MSAPLLAVEGLSVGYAGRPPVEALRDVSLTVAAGEAVGVVGESGSGKSTLIAAAAGLMADHARVTAGSIRLRGEELRELPPAARRARLGRDIALVFQDPMTAFSPVLTLGAQLVDFQHHDRAATPAEKRGRAAAMLARCGVSDPERRLDGYAQELSGGMRQRAAIAAALLARPALLMADEPTTALDATTEAQVLRLLDELRGEAGGVIVVTHHLGVVAQLCDRAVVMYAGEVVEEGPVGALFERPAHPYTAALLACDPARGEGRPLPTIPGEPPSLAPPPEGCAFRARCPQAAARCGEPQALRPVGPGRAARCWRAA